MTVTSGFRLFLFGCVALLYLPAVHAGVAPLSQACTPFADGVAFAREKAYWADYIGSLPPRQVENWIIGRQYPPKQVMLRARTRLACLLKGLSNVRKVNGKALRLPHGARVISGYRSYKRQNQIWNRKFEFRGRAFDRITQRAHHQCSQLIGSGESRWLPGRATHRRCWLGGAHATHVSLSPQQRQFEILQASAAPGLSRHHWGTDYDILDAELLPENWLPGGNLDRAYQWLKLNAKSYGFTQPYGLESEDDRIGRIEEGWHWSYAPIAEPLMTFAFQNIQRMEQRLFAIWKDSIRFNLVRFIWQDYLFYMAEPRPIISDRVRPAVPTQTTLATELDSSS